MKVHTNLIKRWTELKEFDSHQQKCLLYMYKNIVAESCSSMMSGVCSQSGDADFSRVPGLTSGIQNP